MSRILCGCVVFFYVCLFIYLFSNDEMDDDFGDMMLYENDKNGRQSQTNGSVSFNYGGKGIGIGEEDDDNDSQDRKEENGNDSVTVDAMAWTSKFPIFAKPS